MLRKHMFEKEVMMKNKIKQYLMDEFETSYHCSATPESVMEKTDFFNNKPFIFLSTPFYKKEFISSLFSVALLIIVVITLAISNNILFSTINKIKDYKQKYMQYSEYLLTEEDREFINIYTDRTLDASVFSVSLDSYLDLVIYKGYNYDNYYQSENVYFYKIIQKKPLNENIQYLINLTIICDDVNHQVSNNDKIGVLKTTLSSDNNESIDNIVVTVINHNVTSNYEINILNNL